MSHSGREKPDTELMRLFRGAMQMVTEMRAEQVPERDVQRALTNSVKAILRPVPEQEWPHWALVPRCIHCDGYGFIITPVTDRLGIDTTDARFCSCEQGQRFVRKHEAEADFTKAGKTPPKPKGFTKWNG